MAKIKYIRVSTPHQKTQRQEANLDTEGFDKVFIDKASGKNLDRPEFKRMMEYIREGDTVYFESFSRISRSLPDLLSILEQMDDKGVKWYSEKENINTDGATGRLVVAVLGAISAYEREINAERREYGYRKALEKGTVGRPPIHPSPSFISSLNDLQEGKITATEAIKRSGVGRTTFYKIKKMIEKEVMQ